MEWYHRSSGLDGKASSMKFSSGRPAISGKSALIRRLKSRASYIFIFFILFYGLQAALAVMHKKAPVQDLFIASLMISFAFLAHLLIGFDWIVPLFIGIGFVPHNLGLYEVFYSLNSFNGALYGSPFFAYHYDWIVHFSAMFCYAVAFASMSYTYFMAGFKSRYAVFFIMLFFLAGIGCANETIEFVGYELLGYGKGFLEFGDGDSSPDAGPWQNASMDMVNNILGSASGLAIFFYFRRNRYHSG